MNFKKTVKRNKMLREYVRALNGLLNLPERLQQVLALLMEIDNNWKPVLSTDRKDIISTSNRHLVMDELLLNKGNLASYISKLKAANILVQIPGGWEVNKALMPKIDKEDKIVINFVIEELKEDGK